ncbi:MAG: group I intron-associated PD-(D/E)XK endonuclease [Mycobacteriales bacterium]
MRTWTDEQLRAAVATGRSWPEVLGALGFAQNSGSARATVRRHAARLGLDMSGLSDPSVALPADPFTAAPELKHLRASGAYIVAGACALAGYKVSWPLEPAIYDLLVDTGTIQRVQVKTTTHRVDGTWSCMITHSSSSERAWYTSDEIDFFGIVDPELNVYMIPVHVLDGHARIYVRRYDAYRLPRLAVEGLTASNGS